MTNNFNLNKTKKACRSAVNNGRISSRQTVFSLMHLQYIIFLQSIARDASIEARSSKSSQIKGEHVRAVVKKNLQKYRK